MKKPLIVNIVGISGIGVSSVCKRTKIALEKRNRRVKIASPRSFRDVFFFEELIKTNTLENINVILIDNHYYRTKGFSMMRNRVQFDSDAVMADFGVLLTATVKDFAQMSGQDIENPKSAKYLAEKLGAYQHGDERHMGSNNVIKYKVEPPHGILFASGFVVRLIDKVLDNAK